MGDLRYQSDLREVEDPHYICDLIKGNEDSVGFMVQLLDAHFDFEIHLL